MSLAINSAKRLRKKNAEKPEGPVSATIGKKDLEPSLIDGTHAEESMPFIGSGSKITRLKINPRIDDGVGDVTDQAHHQSQ